MLEISADIIGMLGTCCVVGAYFLLQLQKLRASSLAFNLLNLSGACMLLFSLWVNFNLASFVIEIFWISASLVGLWKHQLQPRRAARRSAGG